MATSPKRIVSFVLVIAYYAWLVLRPLASAGAMRTGNLPRVPIHLNFPAAEVLDAILFGVFLLLSVPLLLQLTRYNRTMRAADIDVLFPTPVSPKLVMALRVLRDYLATLIMPVIIMLLTWRPARLGGLFASLPHPETAGYIFRTATMAWLLIAMVWTIYGYAATLFVNRSDLASDRNDRIMRWTIAAVVLGTIGYVACGFRISGASTDTALNLSHSLVLRVPYFLAHLGAMFALGPITAIWHTFASGIVLLALMALGFALALSEVGWMYDQAAVRGFETMESMRLRRSGDPYAMMAASARSGKLKSGRQTWLHRLRVRPGAAMIWREAVIQTRTLRTSMVIVLVIAIAYSLLPVFIFRSAANNAATLEGSARMANQIGWVFLVCQGFGLFMYIMASSSTGFVELLRRIDLMKPLPFTPARLMTVEVFAKTYLPVLMSLGCTCIVLVTCPNLWQFAVAHLMYGPSLAVMLSSAVLVVTLIFPEIDDPTQRGFRGLMQLLGIALAIAPGLGAFIGIAFLTRNPILGGLVAMTLNLAITTALTIAAGYLYLGFNPSE